MPLVLGLIIFTLAVINMVIYTPPTYSLLLTAQQRKEDERFKKIDSKRGGRGFV